MRLKQRGGAIVSFASGMSSKAQFTASAYCCSKAALLMTTRPAAAAGRYNIRVNAVLPDPVNTQMLMGNLTEGHQETDLLDQLAGHSPMGRLATSEEVARAVLFLADPANSTI